MTMQAEFEVFFDGDCPLCKREIAWLQRKDKGSKIQFTDIAAADFDAASYGKTHADFMASMHGRFPDGRWTEGIDTFDSLYRLLGWGWVVAWTRWPIVRPVMDRVYRVFAWYRPWLSRGRGESCRGESCRVDGDCSPAGKS